MSSFKKTYKYEKRTNGESGKTNLPFDLSALILLGEKIFENASTYCRFQYTHTYSIYSTLRKIFFLQNIQYPKHGYCSERNIENKNE